jgi:hypothetical protein
MVDTKPLLMGFGATADVATQIATDKAINSRRQSAESSRLSFLATRAAAEAGEPEPYDISQGELIEGTLDPASPTTFTHSLGRTPNGAIVLVVGGTQHAYCIGVSPTEVVIAHSDPSVSITLWVT